MSGAQVMSLGCRLNIAESERMRMMLAGDDNLVVINSCAVTSEAVRQTRQTIRKARKAHPDARLLVTGCAADIERDQLAAMPEVDGLIANASKLDPRVWNAPQNPPAIVPTRTRAFIAIQNGCDHACSFCVIPQGRGTSRSLTPAQIMEEIRQHLDQGAREIVLTGVDVTSWGNDLEPQMRSPMRLGALLRRILTRFDTLERLRMSSLDGVEIDEELLEILASEPRVMPHLHLSLQHGADLILKRMKRRHLRRDAIEIVAHLKARRPEIAIGADLIAGFPTESADHHRQNLSLIRELEIVHAHIFPYSPRPGTPAARMPQHERALVKARASELRTQSSQVRTRWLQTLVGTPLTVLAEPDGSGYAENFARVAVPAGTLAGTITPVTPTRLEEGILQ